MSQREHFPVNGVEAIQRLPDAQHPLGAPCRLHRRDRRVAMGSELRVRAQLHHVRQPRATLFDARCQRQPVAAMALCDPIGPVAERLVLEGPHTLYPRAA
jgi:hypothetical protein